jgi:ParB family chromosome partitioning protein
MSKKLLAKAGLIQVPPPAAPATAEAAPKSAEAAAPKTAPGSMLQFMTRQSAAVQEADDLRHRLEAFEGAKPVRLLDPQRVKPSKWANRHPSTFESADFEELKAEIAAAGGNVQPIKVRPVGDDYEIVFGHRRHRACLELGLSVAALIDQATDQELFLAMERENRGRKNLSAWEQGRMYRQALDDGLYPSFRRLADAVGVDVAQVSKAAALARLPQAVIDAFPTPLDIQYRWAQPLSDALQRDPDALIARAKQVKADSTIRLPTDVFNALLGTSANRATGYTELKWGDRRAGSISSDSKGRVLVTLEANVVQGDRKDALQKLLNDWLLTLPR